MCFVEKHKISITSLSHFAVLSVKYELRKIGLILLLIKSSNHCNPIGFTYSCWPVCVNHVAFLLNSCTFSCFKWRNTQEGKHIRGVNFLNCPYLSITVTVLILTADVCNVLRKCVRKIIQVKEREINTSSHEYNYA